MHFAKSWKLLAQGTKLEDEYEGNYGVKRSSFVNKAWTVLMAWRCIVKVCEGVICESIGT